MGIKAKVERRKAKGVVGYFSLFPFLFSLCGLAAPVGAQPYPARPIRIIVPFAPGGASDVIARLLAAKLTESLGQTVVVDNRPGAGANIGIGIAARAQGDGHTLLVASSAFTVNPTLYAKPTYDPFKDFQPITCVGSSPNILAVHPSFPSKSVKELVALVRAQPGKHNYSSPTRLPAPAPRPISRVKCSASR